MSRSVAMLSLAEIISCAALRTDTWAPGRSADPRASKPLEARRLVSRLHRRAHPEAGAVHVLRDLAVVMVDRRVEK